MARIECKNGHIYNSDIYSSCPYCSGSASGELFFDESDGRRQKNATRPPYMDPDGPSGSSEDYVHPGKTRPPENMRPEKQRTVIPGWKPQNPSSKDSEKDKNHGIPVVGWLVCIEGPNTGESYNLYYKINSIGRSEEMDVVIRNDRTISRENAARMAYDHKHNCFNLIPGSGANTIYLNNQPIYTPIGISSYDVIEIGATRLVFMALCGEKFHWVKECQKGEVL